MKFENIERIVDIHHYLNNNEAERLIWKCAYSIESVTVATSDGVHTIKGQFVFNEIRDSRIKFLDLCRSQWLEELETL